MHLSFTNNIHEKISPFLLVKSSAVFFKQCRKELIQCKKRKQTKHSDWSLIIETHNLVPRVSHLNAPGVKMRDPGNEVEKLTDGQSNILLSNYARALDGAIFP